MSGLMTCLCAGVLIWAILAIVGSATGRNRRYQQYAGNDGSFWAGLGLGWLLWHNNTPQDDTIDHGHLAEQYLDGDIDTPDYDGDIGGDWGGGSDWGGHTD